MSELLPCPFCGEQPKQFGVMDAYRCGSCCKNAGWLSLRDWNTRRPEPPRREAEQEALIAALKWWRSDSNPGSKMFSPPWVKMADAALTTAKGKD